MFEGNPRTRINDEITYHFWRLTTPICRPKKIPFILLVYLSTVEMWMNGKQREKRKEFAWQDKRNPRSFFHPCGAWANIVECRGERVSWWWHNGKRNTCGNNTAALRKSMITVTRADRNHYLLCIFLSWLFSLVSLINLHLTVFVFGCYFALTNEANWMGSLFRSKQWNPEQM